MEYWNYIKTYFDAINQAIEDEDIRSAKEIGMCIYNEDFAKNYEVIEAIALEISLKKGIDIRVPEKKPQGIYAKSTAFYDIYKQLNKHFNKNKNFQNAISYNNDDGIKLLYDSLNDFKTMQRLNIMKGLLQIKLKEKKSIYEKNIDSFNDELENKNIAEDLLADFVLKSSQKEESDVIIDKIYDCLNTALAQYINNNQTVSEAKIKKSIVETFRKDCKVDINISQATLTSINKLVGKYKKNYIQSQYNHKMILEALVALNANHISEKTNTSLLYNDISKKIAKNISFVSVKDMEVLSTDSLYSDYNFDDMLISETKNNIPRKVKRKFRRLLKDWLTVEEHNIHSHLSDVEKYGYDNNIDINENHTDKHKLIKGMESLYHAAMAGKKYLNIPFNKEQIDEESLIPTNELKKEDLCLMSYFKDEFSNEYYSNMDKFSSDEFNILAPNYTDLLHKLPQSKQKYEIIKYSSMALNSISQYLQTEENKEIEKFQKHILSQNPRENNDAISFLEDYFNNKDIAIHINNKINKQMVELYILPLYTDTSLPTDFSILQKTLPQKKFSKEQNDFIISLAKYKIKQNLKYHHEKLQNDNIPLNLIDTLVSIDKLREQQASVNEQIDRIDDMYKQEKKRYSIQKNKKTNKINVVMQATKHMNMRN